MKDIEALRQKFKIIKENMVEGRPHRIFRKRSAFNNSQQAVTTVGLKGAVAKKLKSSRSGSKVNSPKIKVDESSPFNTNMNTTDKLVANLEVA